MKKSFNITQGKGFRLRLPNDISISTQLGHWNYCDNYNGHPRAAEEGIDSFEYERMGRLVDSNTAEIAIIDEKEGEWITETYMKHSPRHEYPDHVIGHVEVDEWVEILKWCLEYRTEVNDG